MSLKGRQILIAGASRGLGAATARALADRGADLVLASRNLPELDALAPELRACGVAVRTAEFDARRADAAAALIEPLDRLDALINCVGIPGQVAEVTSADPRRWRETIELDLVAAFHLLQPAVLRMRAQGGGALIHISTGGAKTPARGFSAYCAAKAGAAMLMQVLHREEAEHGIRVFSLRPGRLDTDFHRQMMTDNPRLVADLPAAPFTPLERPARAIAYLCSDGAADLAGRELGLEDPRLSSLA